MEDLLTITLQHKGVARWLTARFLDPDRSRVAVQRLARCIRRLLTPDLIDQQVGRDELVGPDQEVRQDEPLLRTAERQTVALADDLERAEQLELHGETVRLALGSARRTVGCNQTGRWRQR